MSRKKEAAAVRSQQDYLRDAIAHLSVAVDKLDDNDDESVDRALEVAQLNLRIITAKRRASDRLRGQTQFVAFLDDAAFDKGEEDS